MAARNDKKRRLNELTNVNYYINYQVLCRIIEISVFGGTWTGFMNGRQMGFQHPYFVDGFRRFRLEDPELLMLAFAPP